MKLFTYNSTGEFSGFYDENNYKLENRYIKISEELWKKMLLLKYKVKIEKLKELTKKEVGIDNYLEFFEEIDTKIEIEIKASAIQTVAYQAVQSKLDLMNIKNKLSEQEKLMSLLKEQVKNLEIKINTGGLAHE